MLENGLAKKEKVENLGQVSKCFLFNLSLSSETKAKTLKTRSLFKATFDCSKIIGDKLSAKIFLIHHSLGNSHKNSTVMQKLRRFHSLKYLDYLYFEILIPAHLN